MYQLYSYSPKNLSKALSNDFISEKEVKSKGMHYDYFKDYFSKPPLGLGAKKIVIENEYVSKSYITDYSNYYSLCFKNYHRFCKRVHFFSSNFNKNEFEAAIFENKNDEIFKSYLGYIVVRPLPEYFIGATILKHYPDELDKHRNYSVVKDYNINLFGKDVVVKSLAYQSQDSVISACATASLWSAFHKTSHLFKTKIPTPSEITMSADNNDESTARMFPNSGLTVAQIKNVIDSIGIVGELRNNTARLSDNHNVKTLIYSYLKIGIPCCLTFDLKNDSRNEDVGSHLVTATGYRSVQKIKFPKRDTIDLLAHQIERFYVHDDRVGPFCRLGFSNDKIESSWFELSNKKQKFSATLSGFIALIDKKIRISYEEVEKAISSMDFLFKNFGFLNKEFIWDIHIDFSNDFKTQINNLNDFPLGYKKSITLINFPKFIWRAKLISKKGIELEFLFDATDIASACYLIGIIHYNSNIKFDLKTHFEKYGKYYENNYLNETGLSKRFYDIFYSSLTSKLFSQIPH